MILCVIRVSMANWQILVKLIEQGARGIELERFVR
jgi:hypothetical protein